MRTLLLLSALVVAAALAALLVATRDSGSGSRAKTGAVSLVGDSLNVGIEPYLRDDLDGWTITTDDEVGRATDAGIEALDRAGGSLRPVVVVSLGTNDPQEDVDSFRADIARVLDRVGPSRCVVWSTIWRDGGPNKAFNEALADAARDDDRLVLVDWARLVADDPTLLAGDGVHGTPDGYAARASAVASAVRDCKPRSTIGERS